mgnify:CR=1 FL=1
MKKTTDYGATWRDISAGIPEDEIARSVREDVVRPGLLFLGTERGVWTSFDAGESWHKLQRNLPAVQVSDLVVTERDLVIGTHGRSFWVMDNIGVLRQREAGTERALQLFKPAFTVRGVDPGVAIDYFLPEQPEALTLEILDSEGALIRAFDGKLKEPEDKDKKKDEIYDPTKKDPPPTANIKAGLNRFTWDMRYPGFSDFPGMILWSSRNSGIRAVPGEYQARLTVDGEVLTTPFEIRLDPRVERAEAGDLEARFALANEISAKVSEANEAVLLVRGIKQQFAALEGKADQADLDAMASIDEAISTIEGRIYQVNNQSRQDPLNFPIQLNDKLASLIGTVESAEARPTAQTRAVFARLSAELDSELSQLDGVLDAALPSLNERLVAAGLDPIERRALTVEQSETEQSATD